MHRALYLGLDASAHGLTAIVIEIDGPARRVVFNRTINFLRDLPDDGLIAPTPLIYADALDRILGRLAAAAEIQVEEIRACAGSCVTGVDQHDYLAPPPAKPLEPSIALVRQLTVPIGSAETLGHYLEGLISGPGKHLSDYWQKRYALPAATIVPWTSDHESRTIGTGVTQDGVLSITFDTSDVVSTNAGTIVFRNGALARDWVRMAHGLDWDAVATVLGHSPGNDGGIMLPWLELEETPRIAHAGVRRFGFDRHDAARNVRGLVEGQLMAMANHTATLIPGPVEHIVATGGAASNHAILQVAANVFGADVYRLDTSNAAALGAALRAYHADRLASGEPLSWTTVVTGFADPKPGHRVSPNPRHVSMYAELRKDYAMLERLHTDRSPIC